jgi:hypothetical protein
VPFYQGRRLVRFSKTARFIGVALMTSLLGAAAASASTMSTLSSVDFIDHVFASGGGSYTKSLTSGADDGWSVFGANAGDTINVTLSATPGTSATPAAYDGAVLLEVTDGIVAMGDFALVTDFSFDRMGSGNDLVVQHSGFNPFPSAYLFGSGSTQIISFVAATTGQYAIGVTCSDELCIAGSTFTAQLSGNTAAVPEPGTGLLVGLGLCALGAVRRSN